MMFSEFQAGVKRLGCSAKCAEATVKLVISFQQNYPWLDFDSLMILALETIPRAVDSHNTNKRASLNTWVVTVVRNEFCSYAQSHLTRWAREKTIQSEDDLVASQDRGEAQVEVSEAMLLLSKALSPLAWSLLEEIVAASPGRVLVSELSKQLGMSPTNIGHLRRELRATSLLMFPHFARKKSLRN